MKTVFLITHTGLGRAGPQLQDILLHNFLRTLADRDPASFQLVFYTDGVKLVAADSPALLDLHVLEAKGVMMLACGTCLDYFHLRERVAVGRVSSMPEIIETFARAERVVTV
jgi:tRNA 2-thiouridine synthesizing protein A